MSAMKKSESLNLSLRVTSKYANSLFAALTTEAEVSLNQDLIIVEESEPLFVDMRARWNTVMRGLAAAHDALKSVE